jgi:hypothetical protein
MLFLIGVFMKKLLFVALAVCCCGISTANAQVDVFFSTSSTDAFAGNMLELFDGGSGSLYVWVSNNDASTNPIDGLDLSIFGTSPPEVTADAFTIENPNSRWASAGEGTLGSSPGFLVENANAIALIGLGSFGIEFGETVLHGTLDLTALGAGTSELSLLEGQFGISVLGQAPQSINFGSAQVVVGGPAIPEPSALGLVGAMFGGVLLRRRRRA